jgi:membrane-bound lytic murein transglycosylase MltF
MRVMIRKTAFILFFFSLLACSDSDPSMPVGSDASDTPENVAADTEEGASPDPQAGGEATMNLSRMSAEEIQRDLGIPALSQAWTGDLDDMVKRRVIRVLTVYGLGRYFLDGPQEKGLTYELFKMFEEEINRQFGRKHVRIHVVFIPVARDELIPGLLEGRGDIAAASLTITPERQQSVDFTNPASRPLSEILVTGPSAPPLASTEDLSGREVYVRASSSYRESLESLNRRFEERGIEPVLIREVSEYLEDEDLLEMVNSGLLEWAVVDDYKAEIWSGVFDDLVVRKDIVLREGGEIGFAIRKDSPELKAGLNRFLKSHRQGTLAGNILINRYFRDFDWAGNALAEDAYERFSDLIDIFRKYGDEYGFDFLIVAAQGYQESRLDQSARSHAGAIGVMQLLPSTAADPNVGIPDISEAEPNIHAGVRYMNFIRGRYFSDPEIDRFNQTLFALAAYNAGPARVMKLREKAASQGYDPNRWFDNVEVITAREVGSEPVKYVANILKYYVAYRLSVIRQLQRAEQRESYQPES